TIGIADGVITTAQARKTKNVIPHANGALCAAAISQNTPQHTAVIAADKAAVADAIAAVVTITIIGLAGVVGRHRQRGLVDGESAINKGKVIVVVTATERVDI